MRFFTTYGIEFTYVLPDKYFKTGWEDSLCDAHAEIIHKELKQWKNKKKLKFINFLECHNDCEAVEINSPIFKKWKHVEIFYNKIEELAKKYDLTTHRENTGGGGGHIHAGIPEKLKDNPKKLSLFLVNIYRDIANRPYLNSLFNEYCDDHSACHPSKRAHLKPILDPSMTTRSIESRLSRVQRNINNYHSGWDFSSNRIINSLWCRNGYINVQREFDTIEFRIFDMPKSLKQLKKNIQFLDAYLRYIYNITMQGKLIKTKATGKQGWFKYRQKFKDIGHTKREFKEFLSKLNLQYREYSHLFVHNFKPRLASGYRIN
jgi:hypothetical protein